MTIMHGHCHQSRKKRDQRETKEKFDDHIIDK